MKGKIYKIEFNENVYIGSTIMNYLSNRQQKHNEDLRKGKNLKLYEECRKHNVEKIKCILIEEVDINNKSELSILEQNYINKLHPNLNMIKAFRSNEDIKIVHRKYSKTHYEKNKEKILTTKRNNNVECDICKLILGKGSLKRHKLRKH
tara:strand:+ start:101 stop:547 length:447 start_codon:yes stop_codon:yes gene_type:complete